MHATNRRHFLRRSLSAAGAAAVSAPLPAAQLSRASAQSVAPSRYVRVRGRVRAGTRGVPNVAISDGLAVVSTDANGDFDLVTARDAFVRCSIPGDYTINTQENGTARLFQKVSAGTNGEASMLFDLKPRTESAERHAFLVLADPQTQNTRETGLFHAETVPDVQALLKSRGEMPTFGVGCGDMMFDDLSLFPEYERAVTRMGVPFFQVIGNHDLDLLGRSDETASVEFFDRYGPTYYSFNVGAMHYIVLDDVMWHGSGYIGYVDETQLEWLESDLKRVERGCPVVVFMHVPLLSTQYRRREESAPNTINTVTNRLAIYRMLAPYKAHVMSGHTHENENVLENGVFEHIHGAVCGAWWTGPIAHDGSTNGYGVYDVRGDDLRWYYKSTGKPATHQMRIYGPGADAKQSGALIANIWNWDPQWQVTWSEDGQSRGPMERYKGLDPLSVELHAGPDKPKGREWVEPVPTDHLFRCTPSASARDVRVEAIDRFGTQYTETWRRGTS
jgi:C terminal of Calcineurin-like phosphoesterase/N terminal of Calcineurin-like phosphoesterase/Calcineurin-like phosphoesterase